MRWKDVDDLQDDPASVGGAMSKWPYQTAWWVCRDLRTEQFDPNVGVVLLQENADRLRRLEDKAEGLGINTETLERRRRALSAGGIDGLAEQLNSEYEAEYGSSMNGCPFESEGRDISCFRCPVASRAVESLAETITEQAEL